MERDIAVRGRFPAINVLKSVSRSMPKSLSQEQNVIVTRARALISRYEDMAELIRLGAYRKGTDREVDEAIARYPALEDFLRQNKEESNTIDESFARLAQILGLPYTGGQPPLADEPMPPKAYPVPPRQKA